MRLWRRKQATYRIIYRFTCRYFEEKMMVILIILWVSLLHCLRRRRFLVLLTLLLCAKGLISIFCLPEISWMGLALKQVDPFLNLVKGRGGALLREKMVEAASDKFVVVADETKLVTGLGGSGLAMPVEVVQFCWKYNLTRLQDLFKEEGCEAKLRLDEGGKPYVTDNSNYIVDLYFKTPIKDATAAGKEISAFEGVVEHGLFLDMASSVIIAGKNGVDVKDK